MSNFSKGFEEKSKEVEKESVQVIEKSQDGNVQAESSEEFKGVER